MRLEDEAINEGTNEYLRRIGIPQRSEVERDFQKRIAEMVRTSVAHAAALREAEFEERVREAIDTYLADLPTSFWGRGFAIETTEGRARATAFILKTFKGVSEKLNR